MPTIAVVTEGVYDEAVYRELILKCRCGVKVITRQCRGPVLGRKCAGLVRELRNGRPPDAIFVICDADGESPQVRASKILQLVRGKGRKAPVHPVVIVQALEALLLADEQALATVGISAKFLNPENIPDPKRKLRNLLSKAGRIYTSEVAKAIAATARVDVIAQRCPSFGTLREKIGAL